MNTPSNGAPEVQSSRPARRVSPLLTTAAAAIMTMTAASSVRAGDNVIQIGVGNVAKKGGGGGRDVQARASATAAAESARDAQARLTAAEGKLADAIAKATAADSAARDAQARLTIAEKKLAELEGKFAALPKGGTKTEADSDDRDDRDERRGGKDGRDGRDGRDAGGADAQPRLPTADEIANAKAVIEQRAQVARLAADAARTEAAAKAAKVAVLQAQAEKARAAADAAKAEALAKAAKLAQAQAEADAADKKAVGLAGEASVTQVNLDQAKRESDQANGKLAAADAEAARAKGLLDAYGAPRQSSVVVRDGSTPTFFGEVGGTFGMLGGQEGSVHGGAALGAFARIGEHVALGVKSNIEGNARSVRVSDAQTVPGSSTTISAQGAVQVGTVEGSGFNFEGAAGMQRESMNGAATGADGTRLEGVAKTYGRVDLGVNYYQTLSDAVRLKIGAALSFLAGRPEQLGSDTKNTAVGGTFNIGVSTK
ncbi:MAG: hypothetical protein NTX63_01460 [Candidatus Peregrinibacteria bacterium]|nr:hypothetical protein [Candidatus Peregrinibacteria bacterium]